LTLGEKASWPRNIKRMAKLFHLRNIHDFENAKSGLKPSENKTRRTVEPGAFPLGQRFVDELTLWTIAKQIEDEAKDSKSK
jgi:hypothetical protein